MELLETGGSITFLLWENCRGEVSMELLDTGGNHKLFNMESRGGASTDIRPILDRVVDTSLLGEKMYPMRVYREKKLDSWTNKFCLRTPVPFP